LTEGFIWTLNTYQAIEKSSKNYNTIVMGPWSHMNGLAKQIGNINFGIVSGFFQKNIEAFAALLKQRRKQIAKAYVLILDLKRKPMMFGLQQTSLFGTR
jgi:hypothetical protein